MKPCYHITSLLLNCRCRNRGQLYTQSALLLLLSFSRPGIYVATWKHRGLPSQGWEVVIILKMVYSWKIMLEMMSGNVVISQLDVLMYLILSKVEKHVLYGESVPQNVWCYSQGVAQTEFNVPVVGISLCADAKLLLFLFLNWNEISTVLF